MKRLILAIAIGIVALAAPTSAQQPFPWAELWRPAIRTWTFIENAEEIAVPMTHEVRVLAVDALAAPGAETVWYVLPARLGHVAADDETGATGIFTPVGETGTCQIWSRTGTQPWRVLTVHLVTAWPWRSGITTGESWLKGSR
jgi:hypothetical protein